MIDNARAEQGDLLSRHRCVNTASSAGGLTSVYTQKCKTWYLTNLFNTILFSTELKIYSENANRGRRNGEVLTSDWLSFQLVIFIFVCWRTIDL